MTVTLSDGMLNPALKGMRVDYARFGSARWSASMRVSLKAPVGYRYYE